MARWRALGLCLLPLLHRAFLGVPSAPARSVLRRDLSAGSLVALLGAEPALALSSDEQLVTALFERVTPGVVSIAKEPPPQDTLGEKPSPAIAGSGFVWDKKHVVTNFHVISELQTTFVTFLLKDGSGPRRVSYRAEVIGYDSTSDVAVLEVLTPDGSGLPKDLMQPLKRGRSEKLLVGQNVFAFGNPFGLEHSLSRGIISGVSRRLESAGGRPISGVIQTDASINPGNSGGPLLNSEGQVIGVNTAILSGSGMFAGVGLAIPIDTVSKNVESILSRGFVKRPLLGLVFAPDVMDQELQLNGIMVMRVVPDGPAAAAGVRPMRGGRLGDVVISMDGRRITSTDDLFGMLETKAPGDVVTLRLQRPSADEGGEAYQEIDVQIKLGQASDK